LHTIAVRTSATARIRAQRQPAKANIPERRTRGDIADELGDGELFRIVDEEVGRLPGLLRAPFVLCCLEGRTRDEAAAALGCSVAAIKSRLERSRNLLRRRLESRGFGLPAAFLVLGLTGSQVRASLRVKAIQSALGCAPASISALLPAVGASLASKLSLFTISLGLLGVVGFGAFWAMPAGPHQEAAPPTRDTALPRIAEKPEPMLDRFGDSLPREAIRRFGTLRFRHAGIYNLEFTPDGTQLIAGVGTAPLAVFDARTGGKLREVGKSTPNNFGAFALSPDGKRVACCGFDVLVWDLETGRLVRELGCGRCQSVAFSPDGKKVAVVREWRAEVVVVEIATGKHLADWTVKNGWVNNFNVGQFQISSLAYSPDGKYLVGLLYEVREKKPLILENIFTQVCLLDAAKGALLRTLGSEKDPIHTFAFQPGTGRLAAVGKGGRLRFWDTETGKEVHQFSMGKAKSEKNQDSFTAIALRFSADGRHCAAIMPGQRETLCILDAKEGRELRRIDIGESISIPSVALSADGKTVASAKFYAESCVRVWDVESGKERLADAGHRTAATVSLSPDGRTLISEGEDDRVIHWDLLTGNGEVRQAKKRELLGRPIYARGAVWRGDWSVVGPRWRLSYTNQSTELEVRSLDGSKQLGNVTVPERRGGFALSPDGAHLAYAFHEAADPLRPWHVLVWNPEREKEPRQFSASDRGGSCSDLRYTHDGKHLIAGISPPNPNRSDTIWIWDVAAAQIVRKLPTLAGPGELILTADDRFLITGDSGRVWELESGKEVTRLWKTTGQITNLVLSADDRFLAGFSSEGLMVWETASWKPIRSFAKSPSPHSMVFSRDGRSLFVANSDSTILEWDVSGQAGKNSKIPNPDRVSGLWRLLAETPDKAYPAVWGMLDHSAESVPYLIAKLFPIEPINEQRVRRLLGQLDAESFAEREEASRQLLGIGEQTLPLLREALKGGLTLEVKKRIEGLMESLTREPTGEQLRLLRALAILEWSGSAQAVEHLRRLAGGAPTALLTQKAKKVWQRCKH
jgi:WD40 repeat protein